MQNTNREILSWYDREMIFDQEITPMLIWLDNNDDEDKTELRKTRFWGLVYWRNGEDLYHGKETV